MTPGSLRRLRRGYFAALLAALALFPGAISAARPCTDRDCLSAGRVRWSPPLPGDWVASPGPDGTVPAEGDAYAAMNHGAAAIGIGLTVYTYRSRTGAPLWATALPGFGTGARLVSVRVWPGVVTAGVDVPSRQPGGAPARREVVLSEATGRVIRTYPAASFGGAVSADRRRTVIVGPTAVTSYDNRSGAVAWSRPTGPAAQAWRLDRSVLYLTVADGGYLSGAPVRALRRISLRTGAQRLVRPPGRSFRGELSRVLDGVAVFTGLPRHRQLQRVHRRPAVAPHRHGAGAVRLGRAPAVPVLRGRAGRGEPVDRAHRGARPGRLRGGHVRFLCGP